MKLKMKNRSQRNHMNRVRPRHGHKYTKYKICLSIVMVICIKQHLSSIEQFAQFATPKLNLKLNPWKSEATLSLGWKKALLIKKGENENELKMCENLKLWNWNFDSSFLETHTCKLYKILKVYFATFCDKKFTESIINEFT